MLMNTAVSELEKWLTVDQTTLLTRMTDKARAQVSIEVKNWAVVYRQQREEEAHRCIDTDVDRTVNEQTALRVQNAKLPPAKKARPSPTPADTGSKHTQSGSCTPTLSMPTRGLLPTISLEERAQALMLALTFTAPAVPSSTGITLLPAPRDDIQSRSQWKGGDRQHTPTPIN